MALRRRSNRHSRAQLRIRLLRSKSTLGSLKSVFNTFKRPEIVVECPCLMTQVRRLIHTSNLSIHFHGTMVVVNAVETKSLHSRNSHSESWQKSLKISRTFKKILESILTWKTIDAQTNYFWAKNLPEMIFTRHSNTTSSMGVWSTRCWIWLGECSTVEARYNEGPRNWQNTFTMTRFRFIIIEGLSIYILLWLARRILSFVIPGHR